eukprot:CAMPEP_0170457008 /NCGR_PEP_ID=MMETSP0123-20130129/4440_1 /TAXON_ID=182087 /ORGANISM="Favella ehrenbergii, Strain Fehren 1" /LENGTH=137 /DNA_ID=CAMNT_0010720651 /DNA_START=135 /DNA_END=545 /DNA_ORIENTATION=-
MRVANREEQSTKENHQAQNEGGSRVSQCHHRGQDHRISEMLEEVDLAALGVAEAEPVGVGQPLAKVAISGIGVAELGRLGRFRERLLVDLIKLPHELATVNLCSRAHRHSIDGDKVLDGECKGQDEHVSEFFGELVL